MYKQEGGLLEHDLNSEAHGSPKPELNNAVGQTNSVLRSRRTDLHFFCNGVRDARRSLPLSVTSLPSRNTNQLRKCFPMPRMRDTATLADINRILK